MNEEEKEVNDEDLGLGDDEEIKEGENEKQVKKKRKNDQTSKTATPKIAKTKYISFFFFRGCIMINSLVSGGWLSY